MTKPISTSDTPAISDDDAPRVTQTDLDRAEYRVRGKPAGRAEWQSAVQGNIAKRRISIMLDAPIIDHFKALAGARGYQTLINETLRRAMDGEHFVQTMRYVLREELATLKNEGE